MDNVPRGTFLKIGRIFQRPLKFYYGVSTVNLIALVKVDTQVIPAQV